MGLMESVVFIGLGVAVLWIGVTLIRQGHPDDDVERDLPESPGPTGEPYPTGSRPAGPGAESMTAEPSESEDETSSED
ncbi:MAG TPA: hypothetical protein VF115_01110 [Acidimicrobiia bacterium]